MEDKRIKIWLDDERPAPEGWKWIKTYLEFCEIFKGFKIDLRDISTISFDHDLGEEKTGYDAICLIEELLHRSMIDLPDIRIHTANPSGRVKMELCLESMKRFANEKS